MADVNYPVPPGGGGIDIGIGSVLGGGGASSGTSLGSTAQQWLGTLSNIGVSWYKAVSGQPGIPPVRGIGIPGSAGQMAPADSSMKAGIGTILLILGAALLVWLGIKRTG